jgi:hypothetical protein
MDNMYVGKSTKNSGSGKLWIVISIILFLWILLSSIFQYSPTFLLKATWVYMFGEAGSEYPNYGELQRENLRKDSSLVELEQAFKMLKKSSNYQQALVNVDSDYLNMRAKPVLGADVVAQLAVGTVVELLYYDSETHRIGGEYGKWCKIRYGGEEGWVWGNYLKLID